MVVLSGKSRVPSDFLPIEARLSEVRIFDLALHAGWRALNMVSKADLHVKLVSQISLLACNRRA